ncbi:MAG: hypothetical protein HYX63_21565 [Gammaproteobacteria bacterium]|nr:hypothetical protein [Gammaproteobacteria bacterium]
MSARRIFCGLALALGGVAARAADLPDPMQPPPPMVLAPAALDRPVESPPLVLTAIKLNGRHRVALINNALVTEGQSVGAAKVLKISLRGVVIGLGETTTTLKLTSNDIKHRVGGHR